MEFNDRDEKPDQTPSRRHGDPPSQKNVPSAIKRIILELGLRYRPASPDLLESHQLKLAAMMVDLSDMPPARLEKAAAHWVRSSAFLPTAADLIRLVRNFVENGEGGGKRLDVASIRNAQMDQDSQARQDIRWVDDGLGLRLVPIAEYRNILAANIGRVDQ